MEELRVGFVFGLDVFFRGAGGCARSSSCAPHGGIEQVRNRHLSARVRFSPRVEKVCINSPARLGVCWRGPGEDAWVVVVFGALCAGDRGGAASDGGGRASGGAGERARGADSSEAAAVGVAVDVRTDRTIAIPGYRTEREGARWWRVSARARARDGRAGRRPCVDSVFRARARAARARGGQRGSVALTQRA